ncbi:MAG: flavodoxin family protein [Deltaproteobacteria bacterium]|nr:flavodoxin family protein [Deltaproteobacteria bacterium]
MKIALIIGSPRVSSNSTKIAERAAAAIEGSPKEVKKFILNELKAKGCQGCNSCKGKTETCVMKDEVAQALAYCNDADYIIATSPIYIGDVTAQLKIFIDRSYCWYKPDFKTNPSPSRVAPGKKLILVISQGNPDTNSYQAGVVDKYTNYFKSHGIDATSYVAFMPHDPGGAESALANHYQGIEAVVSGLWP